MGHDIYECLIETVRQKTERVGAADIPAGTVVSSVGQAMHVPEVAVREAFWRLVNSDAIEFTEGRRVKLGSSEEVR